MHSLRFSSVTPGHPQAYAPTNQLAHPTRRLNAPRTPLDCEYSVSSRVQRVLGCGAGWCERDSPLDRPLRSVLFVTCPFVIAWHRPGSKNWPD